MHSLDSKYSNSALAARALPWTPVRELTANSAPPHPSWIWGDHLHQREGSRKRHERRGREMRERRKVKKGRKKMGVNIPRINSWLCLAHTYCKWFIRQFQRAGTNVSFTTIFSIIMTFMAHSMPSSSWSTAEQSLMSLICDRQYWPHLSCLLASLSPTSSSILSADALMSTVSVTVTTWN